MEENNNKVFKDAIQKMKTESVDKKLEDSDDIDAILNFVPKEYVFLTSFLDHQI